MKENVSGCFFLNTVYNAPEPTWGGYKSNFCPREHDVNHKAINHAIALYLYINVHLHQLL